MSHEDVEKLIHELQVHQIELAMQNEELKRAHEVIEGSRARYADLYDLAPVGYLTLDRAGYIREINLTGTAILGTERGRLRNGLFSSYVAAQYKPVFRHHCQTVLAGDSRHTCELQLIRKDGTVFYGQLESIAVRAPEGGELQCRSILSDITQRKELELELDRHRDHLADLVMARTRELEVANKGLARENEARRLAEEELKDAYAGLDVLIQERTNELAEANETLRNEAEKRRRLDETVLRLLTAIEQATEAICVVDTEWIVQYANPALSTLTGMTHEEIIGQSVQDITGDGRSALHAIRITDAARTGNPVRFTMAATDAAQVHVEMSVSPVEDGSGTIADYVVILRDITDQTRSEMELRQSQKMEAIGTLAGGIAHDFNNILAGVIGFAEMVLDDVAEDDPAHHKVALILKGARRGADLVRRILSFSRTSQSELRPMRLGHTVSETLKLLRSSIPSFIEIREEILTDKDIVMADQTQLGQVIMNLSTNAAQAMADKGGVLHVRVSELTVSESEVTSYPELKAGPYLSLTVSDTGCGMTAEVMERIFDPFFTTKHPGEGTGLGLSVALGIVKRHGGTMRTESEPGKGSTFTVLLPRTSALDSRETEKTEALPRGTESILFVDDEVMLTEMNAQRLRRLGYRVTAFTSSPEACERFRSDPEAFDIVITDYTMPAMTGTDLAKAVREARPDMPIILCTGMAEEAVHTRALALGVRSFLKKPIGVRALASTMREVLEEKAE